MNQGVKTIRQSICSSKLQCVVLITLVTLAVLVRAFVLAAVVSSPQNVVTPDSQLYLDLGDILVEDDLAENQDETAEWAAERPPGYPWFCGLVQSVFGRGLVTVVVAQNLLLLATVLVLGAALIAFGWDRRLAVIAAVILLLDPLSITYSNYILSETLFTFALLGAWSLFVVALNRASIRLIGLSGLALGLTVLIRPITLYLPVFALPVTIWALRHQSRATLLAHCAALVIGFLCPVLYLMESNRVTIGERIVSSIEGVNFLYYRGAGAIAEEEGVERIKVARRLQAEFDQEHAGELSIAERNRLQKSLGLRLMLEHPRGAIVSAAKGIGRTLFGPGFKSLSRLLHGQQSYDESAETHVIVQGGQCLYLALLYVCCVPGCYRLVRAGRHDFVTAGIVLILGYLLVVSAGPEAYSRFRVPLMPFLGILAAVGLVGRPERSQQSVALDRNVSSID